MLIQFLDKLFWNLCEIEYNIVHEQNHNYMNLCFLVNLSYFKYCLLLLLYFLLLPHVIEPLVHYGNPKLKFYPTHNKINLYI